MRTQEVKLDVNKRTRDEQLMHVELFTRYLNWCRTNSPYVIPSFK